MFANLYVHLQLSVLCNWAEKSNDLSTQLIKFEFMSQKLVGTICKYYSKTWLTCALKVALIQ